MSVPVTPDRAQGREWLARELAGPEYRDVQPSWLSRAWTWLQDRLDGVAVPALGTSWSGIVVVVLIVAAVVAVVFLVAGPLRRSARGPVADEVFETGPEPAAAHLRRADAAAAAGDWPLAVAERFRGLVRSLEERDLLDRRPGRTAHEIARQAATVLPDCADPLELAARTFEDVRYGGRTATATSDETVRQALDRVRTARPSSSTAPTASSGVA